MRKLPFLNGIRAFEAAARAESFAKAADELHVTPAAISRMVQLLEQRLGVPLFERKANRLVLTAAGRSYQTGLTQVCSPAMAKRLKSPDDLRNATLLRVAHAADEWPRWFKTVELSKIRVKGPEFEYYGQALQAAADGVGVAIGISPYVDDDLKAGRLVAPFAQSVSKGEHWYLIYREGRKDEAAFRAFRAWILRAAAKA